MKGVDVEDEAFEVVGVEGDDVLVDELALHGVQPSLLLGREDVLLHLLPHRLHELTVISLLYYAMGQRQSFDALHIAARSDLLQHQRSEFFASWLGCLCACSFGRVTVDADVDVVVEGGIDVNIDADVFVLAGRGGLLEELHCHL